jgi:response regulator RpfG family c-di-GMP phosphodiesterase
MKVLYLESDTTFRDYVAMLIEATYDDCELLECSSANEALTVLQMEEGINMIVTEFTGSDKKPAAEQLWNYLKEQGESLPFIIIAPKVIEDTPKVQEILAESSANAFAPKPFQDVEFFGTLEKCGISGNNIATTGSEPKEKEEDWEAVDDVFESVKDQSLKVKRIVEADHRVEFNSQAKDQNAEWNLKATGTSGHPTIEADWSLKADGTGHIIPPQKVTSGEVDLSDKAKLELVPTFNPDSIQSNKLTEGLYTKIKITRFLNFNNVCCDVFFKLRAEKYLKFIHSDDLYEHDRIDQYIEKAVKYLYILTEDYAAFSGSFSKLIMSRLEAKNLSSDQRSTLELASYQDIHDQLGTLGVNDRTINQAQATIKSSVGLIKSDPDLAELFENLMKGKNYISEHSLLLSYICSHIALSTSWGSPTTLEKLCMAAMVHDIGLPDPVLAEQTASYGTEGLKALDPETAELIREHPAVAAALIKSGKTNIPDVDNIIIQHHELPDGSGYPYGRNGQSISPLSAIFIIAEHFVHRIYNTPANEVNFPSIVAEFEERFNRGNFKKPLEGFKKAFKDIYT